MKRLLMCVLFAAVSVIGAQGPTQTGAPRLVGAAGVPIYATDGVMTSFSVSANFSVENIQPGGTTHTRIETITFNLIEGGSQTVTFNGLTYSYEEIATALVMVALKEYAVANPSALPVRKSLRQPTKK